MFPEFVAKQWKSTRTKLSFVFVKNIAGLKKRKKNVWGFRNVNMFFLGDYVTFQLSCYFLFYELHFQSFPYFARRISHFKGNHFWVTLPHFDEFSTFGGERKKKKRSAILARLLGNQARLGSESEAGSWDIVLAVCVFVLWVNLCVSLSVDTMTWRRCWTATRTPWSWRPWSASWRWVQIPAGAHRSSRFWLAGVSHLRKMGWYLAAHLQQQESKCEPGSNRAFRRSAFKPSACWFASLCLFVFFMQMIARGKNASDLFPAVVKNVACKNIEVCDQLHVSSLYSTKAVEKIIKSSLQPEPSCKGLASSAWSLRFWIKELKKKILFLPLFKQNGFESFRSSFSRLLSLQLISHGWFIWVGIIGLFVTGSFIPSVSLFRRLPPQVKKLVYVYLVRYAEEQQDLALLSISTFQRGLKVAMSNSDILVFSNS